MEDKDLTILFSAGRFGLEFVLWHQDHLIHRTGGPAIQYAGGQTEYYKDGYIISEHEFRKLKVKSDESNKL